jgi:hypothetical protein
MSDVSFLLNQKKVFRFEILYVGIVRHYLHLGFSCRIMWKYESYIFQKKRTPYSLCSKANSEKEITDDCTMLQFRMFQKNFEHEKIGR